MQDKFIIDLAAFYRCGSDLLSLFIPEVIAADLQRRCRRQVDDVIEMSAFPVCRGHDAGRRPP